MTQTVFSAGTAGSFLKRVQIYSQDASILGWTCGNLIAPAGSAAEPKQWMEWDLIPDGFLGHPSFMMIYWFVRDSKIFQVSGNWIIWISGSRCWSLVDIGKTCLNDSQGVFVPLQGAHEFFCYSCKTGERNPSLKSPCSEEFFYDLLIAKSIIPAEMVDKMQVPWWQSWFTLWSTSKIYQMHGERTNHDGSLMKVERNLFTH